MTKRKPKYNTPAQNNKTETLSAAPAIVSKSLVQLRGWSYYLIIFLFSCLLYSNTLWNQYALDDMAVLTDNRFTKKGVGGIKDHFTHDTFDGFLGGNGARTVSGGRYRPLSLVTLSLEYELMRKIRGDQRGELTNKNLTMGKNDPFLSPKLSHAVNLILFAFTAMILYYFLTQIFPTGQSPVYFSMPFLVTLLYVAHPIHTEAVANIKGRDEIMTLLFSLLALIGAVKYVRTRKIIFLFSGMLAFFFALLSKENAITFLAIIPLTFYFFTNAKLKDYLLPLAFYIVPVIVFLLLRSNFTNVTIGESSHEVLNNPFLLATTGQKFATIIYTFLLYFKLLVFPHPLTHDYYYNQIPYVDVADISFIFSLLLNSGLVVYALITLKKKSVYSYAILFYFITFSIVSNLFFTVGTTMNERFVYISSLGFCIALAYALIQLKDRLKLSPAIFAIAVGIILSLCSFKTITRNSDWFNDVSLMKSDIRWSPNSAKIRAELSKELIVESDAQSDTVSKKRLVDSAIMHANAALKIYPNSVMACEALGDGLWRKNKSPEELIPIYQRAIAGAPAGDYYANYCLAILYNNSNMPVPAKENLLSAIQLKPGQADFYYLLSQIYARLNQPDSVERWLKVGQEFRPIVAKDYYLVADCFLKGSNNVDKGIEYLSKAIELDPRTDYYYDLGVEYMLTERYPQAIKTIEKLLQLDAGYLDAYKYIALAYNKLGNQEAAKQYYEKYMQQVNMVKK